MRQSRLQEEQEKLEELLKYAYLLDDKDRGRIKLLGAKAHDELLNIKYNNIFKPADETEQANIPKTLVRVFRDPLYTYLSAKHILNVELAPYQILMINTTKKYKYPMIIGSRGSSKSFILAVYILQELLYNQGCKVVITGAGFRQAKVIFNYMNTIWRGAPILRDITGGGKNAGPKFNVDECRFHIGESTAVAIPVGDGSTIRGLRASILVSDEFGALSEQIYEQVISGFAATSSSPIEDMKYNARVEVLKSLGLVEGKEEDNDDYGNQSILSGTADFAFKHIAKYWNHYKSIIQSRGDLDALQKLHPEGLPKKFNWRNYAIIRIPFELIPSGIMDEEHIARGKATSHISIFLCEYGACFPQDSTGFFKRSLIDSCVCGDSSNINLPSCGRVIFDPVLYGNRKRNYVISVDPASENDNFCITVLECWPDHRRVVYCWAINKRKHRLLLHKGGIKDDDFYSFCARKIRNLMKTFPTERIVIDSQGGGFAIEEALHAEKNLLPGEVPIWQIIDPEKEKPTDDYPGDHILELVNFSDANWVFNANHFLKKDMESKTLLLPRFSPASVGLAIEKDKAANRLSIDEETGENNYVSETLEEVIFEIEEMKNELAIIEHSVTANNRDKWDVPEIKLPGSKKGRLRKDRYTALLMGNMSARTIANAPVVEEAPQTGMAVADFSNRKKIDSGDSLYYGPAWYHDNMGGMLVKHSRK